MALGVRVASPTVRQGTRRASRRALGVFRRRFGFGRLRRRPRARLHERAHERREGVLVVHHVRGDHGRHATRSGCTPRRARDVVSIRRFGLEERRRVVVPVERRRGYHGVIGPPPANQMRVSTHGIAREVQREGIAIGEENFDVARARFARDAERGGERRACGSQPAPELDDPAPGTGTGCGISGDRRVSARGFHRGPDSFNPERVPERARVVPDPVPGDGGGEVRAEQDAAVPRGARDGGGGLRGLVDVKGLPAR